MKVLVLGSGGREHALCWAISGSPGKNSIFCAPGNAGTSRIGKNVDLSINDFKEVKDFCLTNKINLVVVGPEDPIVGGIADFLRKNGIAIFGPGKSGAQLEGSKIFAKEFCVRHGIPTAEYEVFTSASKAHRYIDSRADETSVVKADGLAAGKGVIVCDDPFDAHAAIDTCFVDRKFGAAGDSIIIEERLHGFETTLLTIVAGSEFIRFPYSQDHKRAFDLDRGPNTGGMGVFAPTPKITPEMDHVITEEIVKPTIAGLINDGVEYFGCLYFGLMVTDEGPAVLEFNVRFGDPESQAVFPLMEGNFLEALNACANGSISDVSLMPSDKKSLTVILASEGYPGKYKKGIDITDDINALEKEKDIIVFHAGTSQNKKKILTSGGRVLAVTALADDFATCRDIVYSAINKRNFKGLFYRTDIGSELVTAG